MPVFRAFVPGTPRPQGSGRLITAGNRTIKKQPETLAIWRNDCVIAFEAHVDEAHWVTAVGPVAVHLLFLFPRPATHTRKRQLTDGGTKADGPDLDKLARAILDALELARVVNNDRQVTVLSAAKRYADGDDEHPGAQIAVFDLNGATS